MKYYLKFALLLITTIFITLQSCEKKSLINVNKENLKTKYDIKDIAQLKIKEGMLYFDNENEFFKTIKIISKMTEKELNDWENNIGFVSVRTIQNQFYNKLQSYNETDITNEIVNKIIAEYIDFFYIGKDKNGEYEIIEKNDNKLFARICNANNMYIVGNNITKIIGNYQISTSYKNKNYLLKIDKNNIDDLKNNTNFTIFQFQTDNNLKSNCGSVSSKFTVIKDKRWCRNDRRVRMRFKMYVLKNSTIFYYYSSVEVWGQKKYACVWGAYNTNLTLKDMSYKVTYPDTYDSSTGWTMGEKDVSINNVDYYGKSLLEQELLNVFSYYGNPPPAYYFNKFKGTFSSQGVYPSWGYGSCGY